MAPPTPHPIAFVDIETASLQWSAEIWEIGIIRRDPNGDEHETRMFIKDPDLLHADPQALAVGRFYERHPQSAGWKPPARPSVARPDGERVPGRVVGPKPGPSPARIAEHPDLVTAAKAARTVASWTQGAVLVGSNVAFDAHHLHRLLMRHSLVPAWHYRTVDVVAVGAGYLAAQDDESPNLRTWQTTLALPWKSYEISRALGIEPPVAEDAHTALGDARWVRDLWDRIFVPFDDVPQKYVLGVGQSDEAVA